MRIAYKLMRLPSTRRRATAKRFMLHLYCTVALALISGIALSTALPGHARQQQMSNMPGMARMSTDGAGHACDDMSSMGGMSVMGESMAAMANHMCITPLRPKQPGDEEKVRAMVAQIKEAIDKYKDYKKALADGYVIANPKVVQPQYHFNNDANVRLADTMFDPTKPSSL